MTQELKPCGTYAAWMRHYKAGEVPCESCHAAYREYNRKMLKKLRAEGRTTDREQTLAWRAADRRLRNRHRAEWDRLYAIERAKVGLDS